MQPSEILVMVAIVVATCFTVAVFFCYSRLLGRRSVGTLLGTVTKFCRACHVSATVEIVLDFLPSVASSRSATQADQPDSENARRGFVGFLDLLRLLALVFARTVVSCVGGLVQLIRRRPAFEALRFRPSTSNPRESATLQPEGGGITNGGRSGIDEGVVRTFRGRDSGSGHGGGDHSGVPESRRHDERFGIEVFSPWLILSGALDAAFYAIIAGGMFRGVLRDFFFGNDRFAYSELRFILAMMFAAMFLLHFTWETLEACGVDDGDGSAFNPLRSFYRLLRLGDICKNLARSTRGVGISWLRRGFLRRLKLLKTWAFLLVLVMFLVSQAAFASSRRYCARKAVDAWISPFREALFDGVKSALLLQFPRGVEAGIVVAALMAAARVRNMAEKDFVPILQMTPGANLPCILHGAALTCLGAFGGELLASVCIGIRAMILTEEVALPSAVAAWIIVRGRLWGRVNSYPSGLQRVMSFVGVYHTLVIFAEIFRAFLVCRAVDSARKLTGAGGSWALAVIAGALAGSGGLFLPGNRGLSPLSKEVPWVMQCSAYGAALYYLAGSTQPAQAVMALCFSVVALARTFQGCGPGFKIVFPINKDAYRCLGESKSPQAARAPVLRRPDAPEEAISQTAAAAAAAPSVSVRSRTPPANVNALHARAKCWRAVAWVVLAASLIALSRRAAFSQQKLRSPNEGEGHSHEAKGVTMLSRDDAVEPSRGPSSEVLLALLCAHSASCCDHPLFAVDGGGEDARFSTRENSSGGGGENAIERGSHFSLATRLSSSAFQVRSEAVGHFSEIYNAWMGEALKINGQCPAGGDVISDNDRKNTTMATVVISLITSGNRSETSTAAVVEHGEAYTAYFSGSCAAVGGGAAVGTGNAGRNGDAARSDSHACEDSDGAGCEPNATPLRFLGAKLPSFLARNVRPWGLPKRPTVCVPVDDSSINIVLKYISPKAGDFLRGLLDGAV